MSEPVYYVEYCIRRSQETGEVVLAGRLDLADNIPPEDVADTAPSEPALGRGLMVFKTGTLKEAYDSVLPLFGELDLGARFIDAIRAEEELTAAGGVE